MIQGPWLGTGTPLRAGLARTYAWIEQQYRPQGGQADRQLTSQPAGRGGVRYQEDGSVWSIDLVVIVAYLVGIMSVTGKGSTT